MTCTIYFSAEDQDGNALPFNADFILERWDGSRWVVEGTYTIPSGGMYRKTGLIDHPQSYNTVPLLDVRHEDDWKRPNDQTFTCRSGDVTFVYDKITPVPTEGILRVRAHDANTGVYLYNADVYVDGIYYGKTLGAAYLIFKVAPGFHTITLSRDGYNTKVVNTYVGAGATVSEDGAMDPIEQIGHVNVTTVDAWTNTTITGAKVYVGRMDTGKTTPCTIDMEPSSIFGYEFLATKDHFTTPPKSHIVNAGETSNLEIRMQPIGIQCDISIGSIDAPDVFPPPPLPTGLPSLLFGFKIPFTAGTFTYYGIGWVASIMHTPSLVDVTNAFVKSLVVTVNGVDVSPTYVPDTGTISFDLLTILQGMNLSGVTDLKIEITHATRLWFDTLDYKNTKTLETATKTITIPITAPGFCSFAPAMSGPAEIPITLPSLPALPPVIGDSVLDINLGALCENLAPPSAVPIKIFLFGSDTPAINTSVSPTSYTPDLSSHILSAITAMISAGTPIPDSMAVLLNCPEGYSAEGFSTTMTGTEIVIPLSAPLPGEIICGVDIRLMQPAGIVVSQPELGVPGLNVTTLPITGIMDIICTENGASIPVPSWIYPPDIDLYVMDKFVATLSVDAAGNFTHDIISLINAATLINNNTTTISIKLLYPSLVYIEGVTPIKDISLIEKRISIPVTLPGIPPVPEAIVCNITNVVEKEPLIVTISELGTPTVDPCDIDVQLYITPPCGKSMADILAVTGSYLSLNHADGTSFASIPLNIYGKGVLDIASYARNWLLTLTEIPTSLDLVLVCPSRVTFSTPVAEYEDVPITVGIQVTGPPKPPECVLTDLDYYTCPDGTAIQINKCVNGVKVPVVPTPTCPVAPPECVLTDLDYYTCPDGTAIQINECRNGLKVPIVPTPTCPVAPPAPEPPTPEPPTPTPELRRKTVHITTPRITRVGKKIDIVAFVYYNGEKSSGEPAIVTIDGKTQTTTHTRDGKVTVSWMTVNAGLYTICVTVPGSSLCPISASACTYLRVVSELSPPEIEAAEEEFEKSKERIGEILERI